MLFTVNICFGKKEVRCFGLKMGDKNTAFFHAMVKGEIVPLTC